jgi:hypothetical protein
MILYETITLPNGLTLTVWDNSRQIAADTTKVELVARMEVPLEPTYFSRREDYETVIKILGSRGFFEYRKTRSFVKTSQQNLVFQDLLTAFKEHSCSTCRKIYFLSGLPSRSSVSWKRTGTGIFPFPKKAERAVKKDLEALLPFVEKPGRYIGGEVHAVRKDRRSCRVSVALAFPDTYEVGMSHLGLQILYAILNREADITAERVYAPWPDYGTVDAKPRASSRHVGIGDSSVGLRYGRFFPPV